MKNNFTHRLTALLLGGLCLTLGITAQEKVYQLPNPDFSQWGIDVNLNGTNAKNNTKTGALGILFPTWKDASLPVGWHSFSSGIGGVIDQSKQIYPTQGDGFVSIKSLSPITGIIANGNLTTGIIRGHIANAESTENYNYTPLLSEGSHADRFRQQFNGRPDSMKVKLQFIPKKLNEIAQITAWIHIDDVKFQEPNELDLETKAVALARMNPVGQDTSDKFYELSVPFDYEVGNPENVPAVIFISATTNKKPGGGSAGDELRLAYIEFIYNSTLKDLRVNDISIPNFNESTFEYMMLGDAPELSSIEAIAKSSWATVGEVSQEENDGKVIFSVTVKGNDHEVSGNQTTYKLIYTKAVEVVDVTPIVGSYQGTLLIDLNELEEGEYSEDNITKEENAIVTLSNDENGTIGLHLQNFALGEMFLGNIDISDIIVTKNAVIRSNDVYGFVSDEVQLSFLEGAIVADVKANGSVTNKQLNTSIDVNWMGLSIPVTFSGTLEGGVGVTIDKPENNVNVYTIGNDIYVSGFTGTVNVYNLSGVKAYSQKINSSASFSLDKGLYIIQTNETVNKVIVK